MRTQHRTQKTSALPPTSQERLGYIADILTELERMARDGRHSALAQVLRVAREEAIHALDEQG